MRILLKYNQFIVENVQQAKSILSKRGLDTSNEVYQEIKTMLGNNLGYTGWFCKQHFENGASLDELKKLWSIIKDDKNLVSQLSKPVINFKTVDELKSELDQRILSPIQKTNLEPVKLTLDKFYSEQKKFLNLEEDSEILTRLSKNPKSDKFFFNKSSRYHSRVDLLNAIEVFLTTPQYENFDDLMIQLKEDKQNIVFSSKENDIVITKVKHKDLVKWAGDTSWCIKSIVSFNNYNLEVLSCQYIIFLLNVEENYSKIGLTTNLLGWKTSHLKNDNLLIEDDLDKLLIKHGTNLKQLIPNKGDSVEDFDNVRISSLLRSGFTEDEIMKNKKRFTVSDLKFFPERKEFMIKNLTDSLKYLRCYDYKYEDLKSIAKKHCELNDIPYGDFDAHGSNQLDYIVANFSREKLIEFLNNPKDIMVDLKGKKMKIQHYIHIQLLSIVKPTIEELSLKALIELYQYLEPMRSNEGGAYNAKRPVKEMIDDIVKELELLKRPLSKKEYEILYADVDFDED
jgi:hypothetical protein